MIAWQSFRRTLHFVSRGFIHRVALPNWLLSLYPFGRKTRQAYDELGVRSFLANHVLIFEYPCKVYMREMIDKRLSEAGRHDDIFSNLLRAREEEKDGQTVFTDSDLTGEFGLTDHCQY